MILQALKEYYDRKSTDPDSEIAPAGFEKKQIPFLIVIDHEGKFINLEDTRERSGNKLTARMFLVPRSKSRSGKFSYKKTFFLWDHVGYVLQYPDDEKAKNQHATWSHFLKGLPTELKNDKGVSAILKFYDTDGINKVKNHMNWNDCTRIPSCNITFKLVGESLPVPCRPSVVSYIQKKNSDTGLVKAESGSGEVVGRCLITGEIDEIVRVHSDTRISKDSKKLVGFQKNSGYDSYGKEQGYNAPVGKKAEFAYTTALNTLLNSRSKMWVGDTVAVFWSQRDSTFEEHFSLLFKEPKNDNPDEGVEAVRSLYKSIKNGVFHSDKSNYFYVLGLAQNSARIAVRFWFSDTIEGMAQKIKTHFDDISIVHSPKEREFLSLFRLLLSTAVQGKSDNISPNLIGELTRSILGGLPYPQTLLQAVIRRIRSEHAITYPRAALIKACINRSSRFKNRTIKEELKMSLDENNSNVGYRLGRLFAVLEKIQQEAHPSINSTIRDRFYGAASGSPVTVFGNMMRLKNHHLAKLENKSRRIYFENLIGGIIDGIEAEIAFPAHLSLKNQGRFAIGYYHQMQNFFTKKNKTQPKMVE